MNKAVKEKFDSYPEHVRPKIEFLRSLILDVALQSEDIGELEETLKWGEPSYLTSQTKSGTTIRIDWRSKKANTYAMYVNCNTSLIDTYKTIFPNCFNYEGNRAIVFHLNDRIPELELKVCISLALRYHIDKKQNSVRQSNNAPD